MPKMFLLIIVCFPTQTGLSKDVYACSGGDIRTRTGLSKDARSPS